MQTRLLIFILFLCLVAEKAVAQFTIIDTKGNTIYKSGDGESIEPLRDTPYYLVEKNNKWALMDTTLSLLTPYAYNEIQLENYDLSNPYFRVSKEVGNEYQYGLINKQGKEIIPCKYSTIYYADGDPFVLVSKEQFMGLSYGLIDTLGNIIVPCKYNSIDIRNTNLITVSVNFLIYGAINRKGEEVIPHKYLSVQPNYLDKGAIASDGQMYHYINEKGEIKISSKHYLFDLNGAILEEYPNDLFKIYDYEGKLLHTIKGGEIKPFKNGLAPYFDGEHYTYVNTKLKQAFPHTYKWADSFHDGLAIVYRDGMAEVIDTLGKAHVQLTANYVAINDTKDCLIVLNDEDKFALFNMKGEKLTEFIYDEIVWATDSLFVHVSVNEENGILTKDGKECVPPIYDNIDDRDDDGFFRVEKDEKVGLIDKKTGKLIVDCIYDKIAPFKADNAERIMDYAEIQKDGKRGVINRNGVEVVPSIYRQVEIVDNAFIVQNDEKEYGLLDTTGKVIRPFAKKRLRPFVNKYVIVGDKYLNVQIHTYEDAQTDEYEDTQRYELKDTQH